MPDLTRRLFTAGAAAMTLAAAPQTAWDFSFPSIEDGTLKLSDFTGRVLLVTNTASFCGYTYQYEQLQKLHAALQPQGLTVIGIPSQDFNQESADNTTVKQFCETTFGIDFPMAGLSHVRGSNAHPFYQWTKTTKNWQPSWNFNKVLISRTGTILATFGASDEPTGTSLRGAVDRAIG